MGIDIELLDEPAYRRMEASIYRGAAQVHADCVSMGKQQVAYTVTAIAGLRRVAGFAEEAAVLLRSDVSAVG